MRRRYKNLITYFGGILLTFLVFMLAISLLSLYWEKKHPPAPKINYGVTFAPRAVEFLNLDWKTTYLALLDELNIKSLRLPSYWDVIEKKEGEYDFSELDFMLDEANKRNAKVILTLGIKQPRWPECHVPDWVRNLTTEKRQEKTLGFIEKVVQKYKDNPALVAWQVENEPFFFPYGDNCYPPDKEFLKKEINLVRSLDSKPIIITETGELAMWINQMQLSDIFGTTLYRKVWDANLGYISYPFAPGFYSLKSDFFKLFAPDNKKTIVVELQAEPWFAGKPALETPLNEQLKIFKVRDLEDNVEFAQKTGFDEIYLWGAEWWYFMREQGHPEYWEYAKKLFSN